MNLLAIFLSLWLLFHVDRSSSGLLDDMNCVSFTGFA